tara:strand:+ start:14800 stop:15504 length:705 start_codon:yes stop_codon:yes gene_type:complete
MNTPTCGSSHLRNEDYHKNYSVKKFFQQIVSKSKPIIFDVGAHKGESINFFKKIYPKSIIHCFEPNPVIYNELSKININDVFKHNIAISDKEGESEFFTQDMSHLGGLLEINKKAKDSLGYAENALNKKIKVKTTTLDNFCLINKINNIDILKIDVQGYEIGVLKGGKKILNSIDCVSVEVSLYDFYKDSDSSILNVELIMKDSGLVLWDISHIAKNPKNFRTDWVELVYRREK